MSRNAWSLSLDADMPDADTPTIYHNPRCSSSRKALAILNGLDANVVRYLENPPTVIELDRVCRLLGVQPTELIRVKERRFEELGLSLEDDRGREGWLRIIVENPVLLERPIVIMGDRAVVGRPPEKVLDLL
ncbi:MAG: arsenate reductase (glutaredoxin) [Longimicrobiales bacterium]